jgi:hypothetical protein
MDTVGISDIGQMDESELEELLQRAIDPHVPVELFYAVLDRIGHLPAAAPPPAGLWPALEPVRPRDETDGLEVVPLPDATVLMAQVEQLEAAMAGD